MCISRLKAAINFSCTLLHNSTILLMNKAQAQNCILQFLFSTGYTIHITVYFYIACYLEYTGSCYYIINLKLVKVQVHLSVGFSFAKLLRNFCRTEPKFCFRCVKFVREITALCAILRKNHFAQNLPDPVLRNSAISHCSHNIMIHFL